MEAAAVSSLSRRLRWPELDTTDQAAWILSKQVQHDLSHIAGRCFPVGTCVFGTPGEAGGNRPREHVAHADVVVADFLHQRFAERVQARLRRAVGRTVDKRILSGEAADVDDEAA